MSSKTGIRNHTARGKSTNRNTASTRRSGSSTTPPKGKCVGCGSTSRRKR